MGIYTVQEKRGLNVWSRSISELMPKQSLIWALDSRNGGSGFIVFLILIGNIIPNGKSTLGLE